MNGNKYIYLIFIGLLGGLISCENGQEDFEVPGPPPHVSPPLDPDPVLSVLEQLFGSIESNNEAQALQLAKKTWSWT